MPYLIHHYYELCGVYTLGVLQTHATYGHCNTDRMNRTADVTSSLAITFITMLRIPSTTPKQA